MGHFSLVTHRALRITVNFLINSTVANCMEATDLGALRFEE